MADPFAGLGLDKEDDLVGALVPNVLQDNASGLADPLDGLGLEKEEAPPVAMRDALKTNPDKHKKNLDVADRLGAPIGMVEEDDTDELEFLARQADIDAIGRENPATGEYLKKPENLKLSNDDAENLGALEKVARNEIGAYHKGLLDLFQLYPQSIAAGGVKGAGMSLSGAGEAGQAILGLIKSGAEEADLGFLEDEARDIKSWVDANIPWWDAATSPLEALKIAGAAVKGFSEDIDIDEKDKNLGTEIAGGVGQIITQAAVRLLSIPASTLMLFGQGADIMAERAEKSDASETVKNLTILGGGTIT